MKTKLLIVSLAFFGIAGAQNTCSPLITSGLVAYYPFCNNSTDFSGNSLNGVVNGATLTTDRFGNANSAYLFNGTTDYIQVANNALLNFGTGDFTISAWVNTTYSGSEMILHKGSDYPFPQYFLRLHDTPSADVLLLTSSGGTVNESYTGNDTAVSENSQWHHVVGIRNTGTLILYFDGTQIFSGALTNRNCTNAFDLFIGCQNYGGVPTNFFNGKLDDIYIFNRALSSGEINSLYNINCTPSITTGLVAQYDFTGNANDISGSGNNGTPNGATLVTDRFGNVNSAYSFNGSSDYISLPSGSSTSLNITGDFTTSFWIKTSDNSGLLTSIGNNVTAPYEGYVSGLNGGSAGNGKIGVSTRGIWTGSVDSVSDNNWHNITYTLKSDTLRIYIDNVLDKQVTGILSPLSWSGNRVLGCRNDLFMTSASNYSGLLDDIRIYNRALNPCDVDSLYNLPNPLTTATQAYNYHTKTILIYPNPATGILNITGAAASTVTVFNSLGQSVIKAKITNALNVSTLKKGLYFIQVVNDKNEILTTAKIIKE